MALMDIKSISEDAGAKKRQREEHLTKFLPQKKKLLNVIEKAILFFRDNGMKGERFAETIERIGFENVEKELIE